jgi:PAS domain S-box-containing protein
MGKEQKLKILVVDDNPALLDISVRILKKAQYDVFAATDGASCMGAIRINKPDLILLDVMLPDANGRDICRTIKSDPKHSSVYIILISSLAISDDQVSESIEMGADDYIRRPVSNRELLARIRIISRIIGAESRIRESENLLKACIDSPSDMIVLAIDKQFNYLAFNSYHKAVMLNAYGTKIELGKNLLDCITNIDDIEKAKRNYEKAMAGERHITIEEYGELERHYYETRYNPIFGSNQEIIGATAFSANVTGRIQMEQSLKASEEKFRKAFMTSPDSININRLSDGMYVAINEGFKKVTGYSEEEIIGKTSLEINIWADPADRKKLITKLESNGHAENLEAGFRCKDGSIRDGMMSASVIDFEGVPHILSITRDMTERKATEEALHQSEIYFTEVFDSVNEGITYTTLGGKVLAANDALEKILGVPKDKIVGKSAFSLARKFLNAKNIVIAIPALKAALQKQEIKSVRLEYRDKILEVSSTSNPDSKRITGIIRDVTELVQSEESLRKKIGELEWLNQMMVGREVKMIELKKEINEMLAQMGEKEKYVIHTKGE